MNFLSDIDDANLSLIKKASTCVAIAAIAIYGLKQYMRGGYCKSKARLDGKVVVITGANTGIGKETAKDLVRRGAKVYLACRSRSRADQAIKDIQKETGAPDDQLSIIILDLASLKSVREFVREFTSKEAKLDILINNAGLLWPSQNQTEDGFQLLFGVNHLGHFLLTHLLMNALSSADKSRIVNVSSDAHLRAKGELNFDEITSDKDYKAFPAYSQSKLANVLFTRELANRLKGTGITAYSLHPGLVLTDIHNDAPFLSNFIVRGVLLCIFWPFIKNSRDGAQTTIHCAVDEGLASESGKYYSDCKEARTSKEAKDDAMAKKLWDESVRLVKLEPSEIHPKLK